MHICKCDKENGENGENEERETSIRDCDPLACHSFESKLFWTGGVSFFSLHYKAICFTLSSPLLSYSKASYFVPLVVVAVEVKLVKIEESRLSFGGCAKLPPANNRQNFLI